MIVLEGVEMPRNCHECDAFGISDVVGLKCPCDTNPELYDYDHRPKECTLYEIKETPDEFKSCTGCWYAEHGDCSLGDEPCQEVRDGGNK